MNAITIPKSKIKNDDIVVLPRKEYEDLVAYKKGIEKKENDILARSKEARKLKKAGKLPVLNSLKDLR